jgi:hypothetical protein
MPAELEATLELESALAVELELDDEVAPVTRLPPAPVEAALAPCPEVPSLDEQATTNQAAKPEMQRAVERMRRTMRGRLAGLQGSQNGYAGLPSGCLEGVAARGVFA